MEHLVTTTWQYNVSNRVQRLSGFTTHIAYKLLTNVTSFIQLKSGLTKCDDKKIITTIQDVDTQQGLTMAACAVCIRWNDTQRVKMSPSYTCALGNFQTLLVRSIR